MSPETVSALVAAAVGQQFDTWAAEHPSLAAVIDRIRLTDHAVESLRQTPAYRQAIEAYHRDRNQLVFLTRLAELAGPVLLGILGA